VLPVDEGVLEPEEVMVVVLVEFGVELQTMYLLAAGTQYAVT
jgi:hypothetical protein